jgi:uncharacterized membrane protein
MNNNSTDNASPGHDEVRLSTLRAISLGGYFGLLLLLILWAVWLQPPTRLPVAFVLAFGIGPLLLPLRGILHGRAYTHAWASMLLLVYFTHGVVEAYSDPQLRALALVEVALSAVTFFAAALYARYKARHDRQRQSQELANEGDS